jgi:hypothetical protein
MCGRSSFVSLIVAIAYAVREAHLSKTPPSGSSDSELPPNIGSTAINVNAPRGVGAGEVKDSVIVTGDQNVTIHQMPSPPHDFTGRERELNELLDAHEQGGYLITGVQGLGGVGKAALALKLAERLKPRFPDAQFYLDLRGASPQPAPVTEALARVIRAYHPAAQLPDDEASLQALYRSVLDGQRALVLMDNAADRT